MKVEFGQKIKVDHKLKRVKKWLPEKQTYYKCWRVTRIEQCEVIVIGKRTMSNGEAKYFEEDFYGYIPDKFFTAYMVVRNMNENPFYVILD